MASGRWGGGLAPLTAIQTRPLSTEAREGLVTFITVTENRAKTAMLAQFLASEKRRKGSTAERTVSILDKRRSSSRLGSSGT